MAYKLANDTFIVIFKEIKYGRADILGGTNYQITDRLVLSDNIVPPLTKIEEINLSKKFSGRQAHKKQRIAGREKAELSISGDLSSGHYRILGAFFMQNNWGTGLEMNICDENELISYEIHHYCYNNGNPLVHRAKGCVLSNLKILGKSGEAVKYDAVFRARKEDRDVAVNDFSYYPTYAELQAEMNETAPFLFNMTRVNSILGTQSGYDYFNMFELMLENHYADDAVIYKNSFLKDREILLSSEGSFECEVNYDSDAPLNKGKVFQVEDKEVNFELVASEAENWRIVLNGQVNKLEVPNAEKDIYRLTAGLSLGGDAQTNAVCVYKEAGDNE